MPPNNNWLWALLAILLIICAVVWIAKNVTLG